MDDYSGLALAGVSDSPAISAVLSASEESSSTVDGELEGASAGVLSPGSRSLWNDSASSFSNSSMLGSSLTSLSPKRRRNSLLVRYRMGRPITAFLPAVVM